MKTITKTYCVCSLRELKNINEEQYQKEIDKLGEQIIGANFDCLKEDLQEKLKSDYGIENCDINYSLSHCQGDGVCFYNYRVLRLPNLRAKKNLNAFEQFILNEYTTEVYDKLINYLTMGYSLYIKRDCGNRYYHCYTCDIGFDEWEKGNEKEQDDMNRFVQKIVKDLFENAYVSICKELEVFGYGCYDFSEDECLDFADANDLEFEVEIDG